MAIESMCNIFVVTINEGASLAEASRVMQDSHVGSLVVVKLEEGKEIPVGMITDRDIALALDASPNPKTDLVSGVMQAHPTVINKSEGVFEATVKMRENGIKRIPVVNDDGSLYGIISADDLLDLMAEEISNIARIQEVQVAKEKGGRRPPPARARV